MVWPVTTFGGNIGLNDVVLSYFVHNSFICWDVNCGPLSVMNTLGMPSQAIMFLFFNEFDYRISFDADICLNYCCC